VTVHDVETCAGVVHVVDSVLVPAPNVDLPVQRASLDASSLDPSANTIATEDTSAESDSRQDNAEPGAESLLGTFLQMNDDDDASTEEDSGEITDASDGNHHRKLSQRTDRERNAARLARNAARLAKRAQSRQQRIERRAQSRQQRIERRQQRKAHATKVRLARKKIRAETMIFARAGTDEERAAAQAKIDAAQKELDALLQQGPNGMGGGYGNA
jgi:hypothetical protein